MDETKGKGKGGDKGQATLATVTGTAPRADSNGDKPKRDKAASFRTLANKRLAKARDAVNALLPLSNSSNYTFTPEQVTKIMTVLDNAVEGVRAAFSGRDTDSNEFGL